MSGVEGASLNPLVSSSKDGGGVLGGVVGDGAMLLRLLGMSSKRTCRVLLRFLGLRFVLEERRIEGGFGLVTRPVWMWW